MKKIILTFLCLFASNLAFAISGKDAQNYMSREPQRHEYARNTASATDATLRKIRNGSVNKSVQAQINNSSTVSDGSKVSGGGSVTKPADAKATASTMAKRLEKAKAFGKASLPSFVGSAALTALVQGVGWVIDEGGVVRMLPHEDLAQPHHAKAWYNGNDGKAYSSSQTACNGLRNIIAPKYGGGFVGSASASGSSCAIEFGANNPPPWFNYFTMTEINNPLYVPNSEPEMVAVTNSELEQVVENYIINNDNSITNNIINNAYTYDSSNGASVSDDTNKLAVDNYNDIADAVNHASTAPYNANNPKKGYYMITDGEKTVDGWVDASPSTGSSTSDTTSTTTNPDGSTSTETGSSTSEFSLPAFCDWASVVCDWLEWTKEMPEEETKDPEPEIDDQGIFSRTFDKIFSLSGECPPDIPVSFSILQYTGNYSFDLRWLCIFFTFIGYPLIFVSHCMGFWILYETVIRKEIKW